MAKGKGKRGDAKLRVIPGGAAPKVVLRGAPRVGQPSSGPTAGVQLRTGPRNLRRADVEPEPVETAPEPDVRVSAVAPRSPAIPRVAIFVGLVIAIGVAAWALTRGSTNKPAPSAAAPLTVSTPAEWAAVSAVPLTTVSAVPTASAAPSASASP